MNTELKLVFAGSMGAGKTTAIAAISEIEPILTDVINTDKTEHAKELTTVGAEYGEISLTDGSKLRLYGTPGQARFDFLWPIIAQGALGVVLLLDNSRPDPLQDMANYIKAFNEHAQIGAMVLAVGRLETHPSPTLSDYALRLDELGLPLAVMPADVRRREDVLEILEVLFSLIESSEEHAESGDDWMELVRRASDARA